MDWSVALVVVAALAAIVAGLWVTLPFVRARSEVETRLAALEAVNQKLAAEHGERLARLEQGVETMGFRGLPRLGVSR